MTIMTIMIILNVLWHNIIMMDNAGSIISAVTKDKLSLFSLFQPTLRFCESQAADDKHLMAFECQGRHLPSVESVALGTHTGLLEKLCI